MVTCLIIYIYINIFSFWFIDRQALNYQLNLLVLQIQTTNPIGIPDWYDDDKIRPNYYRTSFEIYNFWTEIIIYFRDLVIDNVKLGRDYVRRPTSLSPSTSNIFRRYRFPTYHDVISQLTLLAVFPIWRRKVSQIANFILAGNAF